MNHFTVSVPFILFLGLHHIPVPVWNGMVRRNIWSKGKGMFCFSFDQFFHLTPLDLEAFTKNLRP